MRYEVGALLGRGGMAEVHEGVVHGAQGFERRVAIKRLLPEATGDATGVRMFLDEARIASRLSHAGIVSVLDYGEVDGIPFQVLELVDGRDAGFLVRQARARGEGMPVEIALHIATEVAHALAHAHEAKNERDEPLEIVHRDVKPSNILVSRSGDVKLGDFGIARARERCTETTGFVVKGTPAFMAPEQLVGGVIDARTDVFALGCTLHALVVGQSPLMSDDSRRSLLLGGELPLSPSLHDDVRAIVERAVKRRQVDRYAGARDMAADLGAALAKRLRTDAKTSLLGWLERIEAPRPTLAAATREILSSVGAEHEKRFTRTIPQTPAPSRRTARLFAIGLGTTLLMAAVAGGGAAVALHVAREPGTSAAGIEAPDVTVPAATTLASSIEDAGDAPEPVDTGIADAGSARRPSGDPVPVADGCRCDALRPPLGGLCHPKLVTPPSCMCTRKGDGASLCWVPFDAGAKDMSQIGIGYGCPVQRMTMPPTAVEGDECRAHVPNLRRVDAGWEAYTVGEQTGGLSACLRCETNLWWPKTPGAPCVGVSRQTGKREDGRIKCPSL